MTLWVKVSLLLCSSLWFALHDWFTNLLQVSELSVLVVQWWFHSWSFLTFWSSSLSFLEWSFELCYHTDTLSFIEENLAVQSSLSLFCTSVLLLLLLSHLLPFCSQCHCHHCHQLSDCRSFHCQWRGSASQGQYIISKVRGCPFHILQVELAAFLHCSVHVNLYWDACIFCWAEMYLLPNSQSDLCHYRCSAMCVLHSTGFFLQKHQTLWVSLCDFGSSLHMASLLSERPDSLSLYTSTNVTSKAHYDGQPPLRKTRLFESIQSTNVTSVAHYTWPASSQKDQTLWVYTHQSMWLQNPLQWPAFSQKDQTLWVYIQSGWLWKPITMISLRKKRS